MNDFPLKNWLPYQLTTTGDEIQCRWLNTFEKPFTEPFFDETIATCLGMDHHRPELMSISSLSMTTEWAKCLEPVEPAAFIFHISRCGSTLVSQLLATVSENIVLSEVPFFDSILRLPFNTPGFTEYQINDLLTTAIKYYGQTKNSNERDLFIKTDSWHLFFYKQLRQLYPSLPFVFIYRSPDEVFRSHQKHPGMQAAPGFIEPQLFDFKPGELPYDFDTYLAKVLECYFNHYLDIIETDHLSLFLNYNEGPMAMIKRITDFTNTPVSQRDLLNIEARSRYHSKQPGERFNGEAVMQTPLCLNKAMELYRNLDEKTLALTFRPAEK